MNPASTTDNRDSLHSIRTEPNRGIWKPYHCKNGWALLCAMRESDRCGLVTAQCPQTAPEVLATKVELS